MFTLKKSWLTTVSRRLSHGLMGIVPVRLHQHGPDGSRLPIKRSGRMGNFRQKNAGPRQPKNSDFQIPACAEKFRNGVLLAAGVARPVLLGFVRQS
jgi:hypothetical protein